MNWGWACQRLYVLQTPKQRQIIIFLLHQIEAKSSWCQPKSKEEKHARSKSFQGSSFSFYLKPTSCRWQTPQNVLSRTSWLPHCYPMWGHALYFKKRGFVTVPEKSGKTVNVKIKSNTKEMCLEWPYILGKGTKRSSDHMPNSLHNYLNSPGVKMWFFPPLVHNCLSSSLFSKVVWQVVSTVWNIFLGGKLHK